MLKEAIGTGNTVEEATDDAKRKLGAPEDAELRFETLKMPQKKMLGLFGGSKAEVKVSYEAPDEPAAKPAAPAMPSVLRPSTKKEEKAAQPSESARPAAKAARAAEAPAKPVVPMELIPVENDPVYKYIEMIIKAMGLEHYTITPQITDEEYIYNIESEDDYGIIIGRRGETLEAIQYLARLVDNRSGDKIHRKISVNIGSYREKRNENLRALARRSASQVLKYGRNAVLEPMNPYERRIIHTAVQEIEGVTSHSVGSDGERKVVISLEEGVQPTNPSSYGGHGGGRGGYNNHGPRSGGGRGGYGGHGGGHGGYERRGDSQGSRGDSQPTAPARPPKQDVAGGVLYGKIEVPAAPAQKSDADQSGESDQ